MNHEPEVDLINYESDEGEQIRVTFDNKSDSPLEKGRIIKEFARVLKNDGSIYLVENDIGGEFKNIIEGVAGDEKTRIKQEWLEKFGFKKIESFETNFEFKDLNTAKDIFKAIWGDEIAAKINSAKITHNVAIYENTR